MKNNTIKELVTQFLLIVFSVLLGLYLSERIEERKQRQASEELLSVVKAEVKDNIILLNEWVPYHQEIHQKLDSLKDDPAFVQGFINNKLIFFEKLMTKGTFMTMNPVSDAWDIAKGHPLIVNFNYDEMLVLSRIYNQQKSTFEPAMEMLKIFSSKDVNNAKDAKANLELMSERWFELAARERQLMGFYREGVKILDLKNFNADTGK